MAQQIPVFDAAAVAGDLNASLDQHRSLVKPTLATAATSPMFTREQNGAIVDRAGRVLIPAPVKG